jgi:ATP-dependent 26S proteasome regulatory subunit
VILMSAEQLWLIKECCEMARMLAPTIVVLEDVDLVAAQRDELRHPMYQISLHQLLNEMDGLSSESQVLFILTTNRPAVIEPALSLRPGRVDQAIEFPLPDDECRYRLFSLYSRGLIVRDDDIQIQVKKTEGASPAFIKEFIRKASLIAADSDGRNGDDLIVNEKHFKLALEELLFYGGEVTRNLLGFPEKITPTNV